eukprot:407128_1
MSELPNVQDNSKTDDWSCNRCTFWNDFKDNKCSMCLGLRVLADAKGVQWECDKCTYINGENRNLCEMCGSARKKDSNNVSVSPGVELPPKSRKLSENSKPSDSRLSTSNSSSSSRSFSDPSISSQPDSSHSPSRSPSSDNSGSVSSSSRPDVSRSSPSQSVSSKSVSSQSVSSKSVSSKSGPRSSSSSRSISRSGSSISTQQVSSISPSCSSSSNNSGSRSSSSGLNRSDVNQSGPIQSVSSQLASSQSVSSQSVSSQSVSNNSDSSKSVSSNSVSSESVSSQSVLNNSVSSNSVSSKLRSVSSKQSSDSNPFVPASSSSANPLSNPAVKPLEDSDIDSDLSDPEFTDEKASAPVIPDSPPRRAKPKKPTTRYNGPKRTFFVGERWDVFFPEYGWAAAEVCDAMFDVTISDIEKPTTRWSRSVVFLRSSIIGKLYGAGRYKCRLDGRSGWIQELGTRTRAPYLADMESYSFINGRMIPPKNGVSYALCEQAINRLAWKREWNSDQKKLLFWTAHKYSRVKVMEHISRMEFRTGGFSLFLRDLEMGPCLDSLPKYDDHRIDLPSWHSRNNNESILFTMMKDDNLERLRFYLSKELSESCREFYTAITTHRLKFDGSTIAHKAAELCNPDLLTLLASRRLLITHTGRSHNWVTDDGFSVLQIFVITAGSEFSANHRKCLEIICKDSRPKDINSKNKSFDTAVTLCIRQDNVEMLRCLVSVFAAKLYHNTRHPYNALHVAVRDGSVRMVETVVRLIRSPRYNEVVCTSEDSVSHQINCSAAMCIGRRMDQEGVSLWERVQMRPEIAPAFEQRN